MFFKVTIYKDSSDKIAKSSDKIKLNKNALKILEYLEQNSKITNKEARDIIGLSQSGARKLLKQLVDKNILDTVGGEEE